MSEIRHIIELKLKRLRIDRDKFIRVKNKAATDQRCSEIHILESVLEDADEANEIDASASVLNIQNVTRMLRELMMRKQMLFPETPEDLEWHEGENQQLHLQELFIRIAKALDLGNCG